MKPIEAKKSHRQAKRLMTILTLPGYAGSGPAHWQSQWEAAHPEVIRLQQKSWDFPNCADWLQTLENAIIERGPETILVAHSLACLLVAHWAAQTTQTIQAALLVAPPDPNRPDFPGAITGFKPVPMQALPFPSMVIASNNDPYAKPDYAPACARIWGSQFLDLGPWPHQCRERFRRMASRLGTPAGTAAPGTIAPSFRTRYRTFKLNVRCPSGCPESVPESQNDRQTDVLAIGLIPQWAPKLSRQHHLRPPLEE